MTPRPLALAAAAAAAACIACEPISAQSHNWLPADLLEVASEVGCGPVPTFYDRPGMVMPHFVYGVFPGPPEQSAAFWCEVSNESTYRLVTVRHGQLDSIIQWDNFPDGLSLADEPCMQLHEFYYVHDWSENGPRARTAHRPIQSSYDGVTTFFYRHEGRWLFRILH